VGVPVGGVVELIRPAHATARAHGTGNASAPRPEEAAAAGCHGAAAPPLPCRTHAPDGIGQCCRAVARLEGIVGWVGYRDGGDGAHLSAQQPARAHRRWAHTQHDNITRAGMQ